MEARDLYRGQSVLRFVFSKYERNRLRAQQFVPVVRIILPIFPLVLLFIRTSSGKLEQTERSYFGTAVHFLVSKKIWTDLLHKVRPERCLIYRVSREGMC